MEPDHCVYRSGSWETCLSEFPQAAQRQAALPPLQSNHVMRSQHSAWCESPPGHILLCSALSSFLEGKAPDLESEYLFFLLSKEFCGFGDR